MSSQLQNSGVAFSEIHPFPERCGWLGGFYPAPVSPGIYGNIPSERVIITTNNKSILFELGNRKTGYAVIAMDAGGFDLKTAAAFGSVGRGHLTQVLNNLDQEETNCESGIVFLPQSLRQLLGIEIGSKVGFWEVKICRDDYTKIDDSSQTKEENGIKTRKPLILNSLTSGFKLWLGQGLIAAIPLLIYGWKVFLIGESVLLMASILLALLWGCFSGSGWLKGVIVGTALGGMAGIFAIFSLKLSLCFLWLPCSAILVGSIWMGGVFKGIKN